MFRKKGKTLQKLNSALRRLRSTKFNHFRTSKFAKLARFPFDLQF